MTLFDEPSRKPLPQSTIEDVQHAGRKVLVGMIPFVGVAGSELLGLLTSPVAQRRDDWLEDLQRRLHELEGHVAGFRFDDLGQNEQFVSATLQATQAAIKTHQAEKLEALRNAVLNVALGREPDPNRQHQFLALVDRFSETHLGVLKFLDNPARYFQWRGEPSPQLNHVQGKLLINTLVAKAFPSLRNASEDPNATSFQFIELILDDLVSSHLVTFERHNETWAVPAFAIKPGGGPVGKMTKSLGEDFLACITEPKIEKKAS